jgi:hypothetical protein
MKRTWYPTAAQAAIIVAAAVAFVVFRWWEWGWVLLRGDYPGAGPHTWYWYAQPFLTLAVMAIILFIVRRLGRRPSSRT